MEKIKTIKLSDALSFEMILVEGGEFKMGDDKGEYDSEKPAHLVKLGGFYIGKYQLTQAVWEALMGNNPSEFKGANRPVESVSWDNCHEFLKKLNKKTGKAFRLPTEAEWEYASRGGQYSQGYLYAGSDKLKQVGWYDDNSNNQTQEVGELMPNELGLYDMSGNVWEWCEDDWHGNYQGAPVDGTAWLDRPTRGSRRVLRGGSCFSLAVDCRSTLRRRIEPGFRNVSFGLRLALSLQSVG